MATPAANSQPNASPPAPKPRSGRKTSAQRYAEQCKPLPAVAGETTEERVERLDRSLDHLTQCFQDEFEVRDEGSLLVNIVTKVLIPFAALSAAVSLLYVRSVGWAAGHISNFERIAAAGYLAVLGLLLLLLLVAHATGHPSWVTRFIDKTGGYFHGTVPVRKETLTRNNLVNQWIYLWIVGAIAVFIPLTFIALRSGVADELGVRLVIDTADVCDGPGRFRIFTGSATCVDILEDDAPPLQDTGIQNATGSEPSATLLPGEVAHTTADARVAEIRLDATTTLALAVVVLILGVLGSMAIWWWRNRRVRDIDVM